MGQRRVYAVPRDSGCLVNDESRACGNWAVDERFGFAK